MACAATPTLETEGLVHVDSADIDLARAARAEMLGRFQPYDSPAVQEYVQSVGARLAAGAPRTNVAFRFTVLDTPGVFAYSFADGEVLLGRGLLLYLGSEAELAAVLAHEIGHVVSLHQTRQWHAARRARELEMKLAERFGTAQARDALGALSLARVRGYSREFEIEADVWSERLLARAGYDPGAMAQVLRFFVQQESFWDRLGFELWDMPESGGGQGVFATHPSPADRLEHASTRRPTPAPAAAPEPDPAYLARLHDLVYGLPERYGVLRGRRYVDPARRVGFTLPEGWYLFGAGERVVAAPRTHAGLVLIGAQPRANGEPRRAALEALARGHDLASVERLSPSGETALIEVAAEVGTQPMRLAVLDVGNQRLSVVVFGLAPDRWSEMDAQTRALLGSVRLVPQAEARAVRPLRLGIERARVERAFAPEAQPFADHPRERWELLNRLYPQGAIPTGRWIKTIR